MITPEDKAAALRGALQILGEAHALQQELERRTRVEGAEEFVGRSYLEIDGVYTGKSGEEEGVMIEGIAAAWTQDREDEMFEQGAFDRGIEAFMKNPILVYSHSKPLFETTKGPQKLIQIGVVKELRKDPERGLLMKAFVRRPPSDEPFLTHVYNQVKSGEMKGLSVGGKFRKLLNKIVSCDLQEVSIAPNPINRDTLITRVVPVTPAVSQGGVE